MKTVKVYLRLDPETCGVAREWLHGQQISRDTVKIDNIPVFTDRFSLGALVRVRARRIVGVVEKSTRTRRARYPKRGSERQLLKRWVKIQEHLKQYDIPCESVGAGFFVMAVPGDVSDDRLGEICADCEVPVKLYL